MFLTFWLISLSSRASPEACIAFYPLHLLQFNYCIVFPKTSQALQRMFRRSSSSKLSRSKSTSSAHSKHELIDPQTARQHAQAAATLAFARAQDRGSADIGHSRSHSRSRNDGTCFERNPYRQQAETFKNDEQVIKRQQSVRFAGPNAVRRRQSTNDRASQPPLHQKPSTATLRPVAMTTTASVPAAYRPPSRSSSIGKASFGKPTAESFATALEAYDEYYTQEPEMPSTPSSYRRLRKSKSMFSPLKAAPHVFYSNGTPDRETSTNIGGKNSVTESRTPQSQHHVPLRAPKSMSFLRGGKGGGFRHSNDEAVQMARDRFFQEATQERLRSQPSFIFRSRTAKAEKVFRKSVRSGSGNSDSLPIASANQDFVQKDSKLRDKARKASKTLKLTLKRVFRLSRDESVEVPNQQVDARETHVRHYSGGSNVVEDNFLDIPHPAEPELSRVQSRVPSLRMTGSSEYLKSQVGSVRSARSLRSEHSDDGSRVTSWTSTANNTINSHGVRGVSEREQQRLSIINENGVHTSSASMRRGARNQVSGYPTVRSQSRDSVGLVDPLPQPVDSARVYSALMKRLDENAPKRTLAPTRASSVESMRTARYTPRQSTSVKRGRQTQKYPTIRQVRRENINDDAQPSNEDSHRDHHWVKSDSIHTARTEDVFGYTGTHIHQWLPPDLLREARMRSEAEDDVFYGGNAPNDHYLRRAMSNASTSVVTIQQPSHKTSFYTVPEEAGRTPQEIAIQNEPVVVEPNRIRESRSTFFGGTSITTSKTTSPYRRALAESEHHSISTEEDATSRARVPNESIQPYHRPGKVSIAVDGVGDRASQSADSESLYSRTTSGHTQAANSALSLLIDERQQNSQSQSLHDSNTGDAIIIDSVTYRPSMISSVNSHHRDNSSAGSNEWKSWMSHEVSKLERGRDSRAGRPYVNYALPTMPKSFPVGHVRENAQYDEEDVEVAERKAIAVKLPLGMVHPQNVNLQTTPHPKPILKKVSQVSLDENSDPRLYSTSTVHIPLPPPIPARSPLRPTHSRTSLRSVNTITPSNSGLKPSSTNGRNVLHKKHNSTATLRTVKSSQSFETPAKLVKKHGRLAPATGSSPGGLGVAVERQFGSLSTGSCSPSRYHTKMNRFTEEGSDDIYGVDGAGLMGPPMGELSERDAQAMGSRKMVELFLSSRRRRINGASEEDDGGGSFL